MMQMQLWRHSQPFCNRRSRIENPGRSTYLRPTFVILMMKPDLRAVRQYATQLTPTAECEPLRPCALTYLPESASCLAPCSSPWHSGRSAPASQRHIHMADRTADRATTTEAATTAAAGATTTVAATTAAAMKIPAAKIPAVRTQAARTQVARAQGRAEVPPPRRRPTTARKRLRQL